VSRHPRPTDAFVDESSRGRRYWMGCVLIDARHLTDLRPQVEALGVGGARVHFNNESRRQRTRVLDAISAMPLQVVAVFCQRDHGVTEFRARAACLEVIVRQLQSRGIGRLIIESRVDDRDDQRTIRRCRRPDPTLVFEHRPGRHEPMLWVADAVTWAVGAGGAWRLAIEPVLDLVVETRP
jgi:hypothetical protein